MAEFAPAIYDAVVTHTRRERLQRTFRHRIYMWLVDIDHLPRLPFWLRPFAGFNARDHLDGTSDSLSVRVSACLREHGVESPGGRILMLANPRVLGYTFNPISLFWCLDQDDSPTYVIAEVHNTHGQRHAYLLHPDDHGYAETDKEFYVSPFLPVSGRYEIRVPPPGREVAVSIVLRRDGEVPFVAGLRGRRRPATAAVFAAMVLRRPLLPQRIIGLIHRHGIALWLRKIPVVRRSEGSRSA